MLLLQVQQFKNQLFWKTRVIHIGTLTPIMAPLFNVPSSLGCYSYLFNINATTLFVTSEKEQRSRSRSCKKKWYNCCIFTQIYSVSLQLKSWGCSSDTRFRKAPEERQLLQTVVRSYSFTSQFSQKQAHQAVLYFCQCNTTRTGETDSICKLTCSLKKCFKFNEKTVHIHKRLS